MNPFLIRAGCVIVAAVIVAVWSSYSRRSNTQCHSPQSPKYDGKESTMCTICYDNLAIFNKSANAMLPCKHQFHLNCIKMMHNTIGFYNCPNCRRSVSSAFVTDLLKKEAYTYSHID